MRDIKGNVVNIQVSGPASAMKAKKLAEPRKIMLGGDLAGSVEFDGSQDVVLEAKVLNAQETAKPDYSQNDEAQPDYIKHRPGGYDVVTPGVTIQWDGVIGDRTVLTIVNDDIFRDVKISDVVLVKEMLIGATADGAEVQEGYITDGDGYVSLAMGSKQILSFSKTGSVDVNGFEHRVTETGTYAYVPSMDPVLSNLYIAELVTANVVKPVQIPAKYLDLATPDYHQNDATQPDYIKNRPGGYYQTVPAINIQWDGVVGDKPNAVIDENVYAKVSDEILTADRVIGATVVGVRGAESQSGILSEDKIMSGDGVIVAMAGGVILSCSKTTVEMGGETLTLPETGTYFSYMEEAGDKMYVSGLTKPETQELVPIPGELTNIKGGYDLAGQKVLLPKEYVEQPELSNVAYSGDYSDLLNKPTLAAVATSGDFNDLSNKPAMLTPNSRNYDAAYFTKSSKEIGWLSVYPTIEYNQTSGKFYKNNWETNGLSGNDLPITFWTSMEKKLDGMQSVRNLDCLLRLTHTGASSGWGISGLAFTSYGIYEVTSNSILLSESEGLFLEFSPLQTMVLRSSTAGSTKKFKITVDDAGTLSATEVTT